MKLFHKLLVYQRFFINDLSNLLTKKLNPPLQKIEHWMQTLDAYVMGLTKALPFLCARKLILKTVKMELV